MRVRVTPGVYTLADEGYLRKYSRNAIPGTFPRRFWDVEFTDEQEEYEQVCRQLQENIRIRQQEDRARLRRLHNLTWNRRAA